MLSNIKIEVQGVKSKKKIASICKGYEFEKYVINRIVDIDYVKIMPDKIRKKGYFITIIQKDIEAPDIMDDFKFKFKEYSLKTKNKIEFIEYVNAYAKKGKPVSIIRFYYNTNLFEKSLL